MELPQYTLRPNTNRMVAPWILKLLVLAALFYGGIYFNVKYAVRAEIPPIVNLLIFAFLIVLVVTQVFLYNIRFGKYRYQFYTNRVEFEGKKVQTFMFSEYTAAALKQNMFDRMFNTGSIRLTKDFSIGPISGVTQVKGYLEQLIKYHLSMQERYRAQQQESLMQRQMAQQQPIAAQQQSAQQPTAQQAQPGYGQQPAGVLAGSSGVSR